MRNAFAIARNEIRLRIRDKSAFAQALFFPLALAIITTVAFGSYNPNGATTRPLELAFANLDRGGYGAQVAAAFDTAPLTSMVRLHVVSTAAAVQKTIDSGTAQAGLYLPANFSSAAAAGRADLHVVTGPQDDIQNTVASAIGKALLARVNAVHAAVVAALNVAPHANVDALTRAAVHVDIPINIVNVASARSRGPASYFGPSMEIMVMFFAVAFAGKSLWFDKRTGLVRRVEATSTTLRQVVIGKALGATTIAFVGALVLWSTMTMLFSTSWGSPALVLLLLAGVTMSSLGIALFVTGIATSEERLDVVASLTGFVFAIVGGNLIPYHRLPADMETVSKFTPNAWALRGFVDVGAGATSIASIAGCLAALCAMGLVFGALGLVRLDRALAS